MSRRNVVLSVIVAGLVLTGLAVSCGGGEGPAPEAPPPEMAPGELSGEELLQDRGTECHGLGPVEVVSQDEAEWEATVERMRGIGAQLTDAEAQTLVEYLAETYGP